MNRIVGIILLLSACSSSNNTNERKGNFKTPAETTEELKGDHILGKDATTWYFFQDEKVDINPDIRNPLWNAATVVLKSYPILFNHFQAGIIQTDWVEKTPHNRFRITAKILGTSILPKNVEVSVTTELKNNDKWEARDRDSVLEKQIHELILNRAGYKEAKDNHEI
jgi:hypothetical protein